MSTSAPEAMLRAGLLDGPDERVNAALAEVRLLDHHVHSVLRGRLTREALIGSLSETDRPEAALAGGLDHQLGIAVRRWCAPLLGLEAHLPAEEWLAHRLALENEAVATVLLPLAGLERLLVDTGYRASELVPLSRLGDLARAPAEPVIRLEALAEEVITSGVAASGFAAAFRDALAAAVAAVAAASAVGAVGAVGAEEVAGAAGTKSIIAYRFGLDFEPAAPEAVHVADRAGAWLRVIEQGAAVRLTDPLLLRFVLWSGVETRLPLQLHTGYGDSDLDLGRCDPLLLTGFLRLTQGRCPILLLHTYPFHRNAGYLAQMFPHVYMDVGLALNHMGVQSGQLLAESMEVAPLRKILFSSDAWGLPELHLLGSWLFRRGLSRVLGRWVAEGDWSIADARLAIELMGRANAATVYGR